MKDPEKLTKKERIDWTLLFDVMSKVEYDLAQPIVRFGRVPVEWETIAREGITPAKTRVTARFDADVVKFFRALGPGYQEKMNRVLKAYVLMRSTGLVEGAESREIVDKIKRYRSGDYPAPEVGGFRAFMERGRGMIGGWKRIRMT